MKTRIQCHEPVLPKTEKNQCEWYKIF